MFWTNNRISFKLVLTTILTIFVLIGPVSSLAGPIRVCELPVDKFTTKYDAQFKKYSKRYFGPAFNWKWFKAQTSAESAFKEDAVSPVGAQGLMQIMPKTMKYIVSRNSSIPDEVFAAKWNIAAGIYYNRLMYNQWTSERPELDRIALMFACYNAGLKHLLDAQELCFAANGGCCNLWSCIKIQGINVDAWKQEETLGYVHKIFRFMGHRGW